MRYGTDYTNSAINLTNSPEVSLLLSAWREAQAITVARQAALDATAESKAVAKAAEAEQIAHDAVREAVTLHGGYQDIDKGLYALLQRRTSVTYDPKSARKAIPMFADAVIVEAVDSKAIHGLLKGGLITEAQVGQFEVRKDLTSAFIVGVVTPPRKSKEGPNAD